MTYLYRCNVSPRAGRSVPPFHDISTGFNEPPPFAAILPLCAGGLNTVVYGGGLLPSSNDNPTRTSAPRIRSRPPIALSASVSTTMWWYGFVRRTGQPYPRALGAPDRPRLYWQRCQSRGPVSAACQKRDRCQARIICNRIVLRSLKSLQKNLAREPDQLRIRFRMTRKYFAHILNNFSAYVLRHEPSDLVGTVQFAPPVRIRSAAQGDGGSPRDGR